MRRWMIVLGAILVVALAAGAFLYWQASQQRYAEELNTELQTMRDIQQSELEALDDWQALAAAGLPEGEPVPPEIDERIDGILQEWRSLLERIRSLDPPWMNAKSHRLAVEIVELRIAALEAMQHDPMSDSADGLWVEAEAKMSEWQTQWQKEHGGKPLAER